MSSEKTRGVLDTADRVGLPPGTEGVENGLEALERPALAAIPRRTRGRRSVVPLLVALVALGAGGVWGWRWWQSQGKTAKVERTTHVVRRADLPIVVADSGNLKALHSEVIKSQVEGKTTIISLVPEGIYITDEDAKKGKVLVELDSADLRDRLTQQEITHANAKAAYAAAKEDFEIERSSGESKIKEGELNVKFGRMDLEHYVGQALCAEALAGKVDLLKLAEQLYGAALEERRAIEAQTAQALRDVERALQATADEAPTDRQPPQGSPPGKEPPEAANDRLASVTEPRADGRGPGGEALQTQRKNDAAIELAIEKFKRAADKLIWTARLEKKGFVSHNELEADHLALRGARIDLEQALTARELFLRYEFPKEAEKLLSLYVERGKELDRIQARVRATVAQTEAKMLSAEAAFRVQDAQLQKLQKQIEYCTIRATKPGLVVYASSGGHWHDRSSIIEEGGTVYERQEIIKLPDTSALAVEIKVHESVVDKVKVAQEARITIDPFPNLHLTGKVSKVAILPDSSSWWLNPDLKQYLTEVTIDGVYGQLKPGMSAQVEILVDTLKGVLQVPVQAVSTRQGKPVVYVVGNGGDETREVQLGDSNDKFVEVRSGLQEGERVLLEAPQTVTAEEERKEAEAKEAEEEANGPPATPPGPRPAVRPEPGGEREPGEVGKGGPRPGGEGKEPKGPRPGKEPRPARPAPAKPSPPADR